MSEGYIGIYRKMMKWEWYQDQNTKAVFIHLCLMACHEISGANWQGQHIERGQLITGRKRLAKDLGLSEQQIRTSLLRLKATNDITIESTTKNSIITIVNYETYNPWNEKRTSQPTNDNAEAQPKPNQSLTTLKNVEELKELNTTNNAPKSTKKKRKKSVPVRDNPPSKDEILIFCDEARFNPDYIDPKDLYHFYVTDKPEGMEWTYKDGKDVMNWKSLFRNVHDKNKKQGKVVNNNYVQDQSQDQGQTGSRKVKSNHPDDPYKRDYEYLTVEQVVWSKGHPEHFDGEPMAYVRRADNRWFNYRDDLVEPRQWELGNDYYESIYDCIREAIVKT